MAKQKSLSSSLSTTLLIKVELPGCGLNAHLSFSVRPSRTDQVADGVVRLLHSLCDEYQDDFEHLDLEGSQWQVEMVQRKAMEELEKWKAELQKAEEWKIKIERAKTEMNKMRDMHFKELLHLREQVYQKSKAEKDNRPFVPTYATFFDPSDFAIDDEVGDRVKEKVSFLQQEFDDKSHKIEMKFRARLDSLNTQLMTTKMLVSRKEKLLEKVMSKHGYADEDHVQGELGAVRSPSKEKLQRSIDKRTFRAENEADDQAPSDEADGAEHGNGATDHHPVQQFRNFLERKFGSVKEAKAELDAKYGLSKELSFNAFHEVLNELGYTCDSKALFQYFSQARSGSPSTTLNEMLELPRRNSECGASDDSRLGSLSGIADKLASMGKQRRRSTPAAMEAIEENGEIDHNLGGNMDMKRKLSADSRSSPHLEDGLSDSDSSEGACSSVSSASLASSCSKQTKSLVAKAVKTFRHGRSKNAKKEGRSRNHDGSG